jgi:malonyl-CoA O-methyltransferase
MPAPTPSTAPPTLDPIACARWLARGEASWLHDEVGQRMEARLQWMRQSPHTWLDWMPLNGGLATHQRVRERYPQAKVYVHEASAQRHAQAWSQLRGPWWAHVWQRCLGRDTLQRGEPPAGQMQMLWANMVLHLTADPQALLKQWQQMLAPDGFVMFSCLGPDTLRELTEVYRAQGWPAPSHDHTDMHDWGDMLVQSGFAEPVMDMERLTLTYASPERLLEDLRRMGRNLRRDRFTGLRGRAWLARLHQALMGLARPSHDGRLVLTIEVIYGHALKAAPRAPVSETSTVSLQDMRAMLKSEST